MKIRIKRGSVWSSVSELDFCCCEISNSILNGKTLIIKSSTGTNSNRYDVVFGETKISYCPYCGAKIEELEKSK